MMIADHMPFSGAGLARVPSSLVLRAGMKGVRAALTGMVFALAFAAGGARAFEGPPQPQPLTPPADIPEPPVSRPVDEAFRTGTKALRSGQTAKGVDALSYAAAQGHAAAQWKLGRMYADGDGVKQDDAKAFDYFSKIANSHAEEYPGTPRASFAANAFVALGSYYLVGIPSAGVKRDPARARDMYAYAASYFGDPEAQYRLGKMYLEGTGVPRDPRSAARWLILSSQKGHYEAQALLGHMLFRGDDGISRQGARGLMWLTLARDSAAKPGDQWVVELYDEAFSEATPEERAQALGYLEAWMRKSNR